MSEIMSDFLAGWVLEFLKSKYSNLMLKPESQKKA